MKRFLLLFLAFVLPLQLSWAATHVCDDMAPVVRAAAHAIESAAGSQASPADHERSGKADKAHDACCGAAHACHGLHSLIGQADKTRLPAATSQPVAASPPALFERDALVRIERPQWPLA